MSAARSYPPPPDIVAVPTRAKPIRRTEVQLDTCLHVRSDVRRDARRDSRRLVLGAMQDTRGTLLDVAAALDVSERAAGRALSGEHPLDLGDLVALARSGPGGARLARRIVTALRDAIDDVDR